jgi:hypothetical protein
MTVALCLYCGESKFGALNPCPYCDKRGSGNLKLDLTFSDHYISHSDIETLGSVIKRIRAVCPDDQKRYNAFFHFVACSNPTFLQTTLNIDERSAADIVLAKAKVIVGEVSLPNPDDDI